MPQDEKQVWGALFQKPSKPVKPIFKDRLVVDEEDPLLESIPIPTPAASEAILPPKPEKVEEVQVQVILMKSHLTLVKEQYPELSLIQQRVLNYIQINKTPFPVSSFELSRFLKPHKEPELIVALQFLLANPKYKLRCFEFNGYDGYEQVK